MLSFKKIDHLRDPMTNKSLQRAVNSAVFCLVLLTAQAQTFTQIESAEYDPVYNRWLVSNGSSIIAQAQDGTLSYFGSGAADYGMEVMGNTLFAISGSTVKGYDLATGAQVMSVSVSGAGFLNGMASDGVDRLWVTDFNSRKIYELNVAILSSPAVSTVVSNTISQPNGIVHDPANNRLVFVNWGSNAPIKAVALSDYSMSTLTGTTLANCDGIDIDGNGDFYVASWSPTRITKFSADFSSNEIIPASGLSSPADISYAHEIDVLGIANSGNETLTLIDFAPSALTENSQNVHAMKLFPNPVISNSLLEFQVMDLDILSLEVFDISGRKVKTVFKSKSLVGPQRLILDRAGLSAGFYAVVLTSSMGESTLPFVVSLD